MVSKKGGCGVFTCSEKVVGARTFTWVPPQLGVRIQSWTDLCARHLVMWTRAEMGLPPEYPHQPALELKEPDDEQRVPVSLDAVDEALGHIPEDSDRGFSRSTDERGA